MQVFILTFVMLQEKVRLKFRISYESNGNSVSDMGESEWMPESSASLL